MSRSDDDQLNGTPVKPKDGGASAASCRSSRCGRWMPVDALAVASGLCAVLPLVLLACWLSDAKALDTLVFDHWKATMTVLAITGAPGVAFWFWMLADAIRRQFDPHARTAKLWHAVLLVIPLSAFVYYLAEWRPRALRNRKAAHGP